MGFVWQGSPPAWDDPATSLAVVAPNDGADLPGGVARLLWVGGAGAIALVAADDTTSVVLSGIPAGTLLRVAAKRVLATGTTATAIVALR